MDICRHTPYPKYPRVPGRLSLGNSRVLSEGHSLPPPCRVDGVPRASEGLGRSRGREGVLPFTYYAVDCFNGLADGTFEMHAEQAVEDDRAGGGAGKATCPEFHYSK